MLEPIDLDGANVVGYKLYQEMTTEDIERIHDDLRAAISEHDSVRLYTDVTGLEGVDPEAVIEDLKMTPEYVADIDRYAIVGEEKWHQWLTTAGDVVSKGEARYFSPEDAGLARSWISGD